MRLLSWISILSEPPLLLATAAAAGLPLLLVPGQAGQVAAAVVVGAALWLDHRIEDSVRRLPVRAGPESMEGQCALVLERLGPAGLVRCVGETWKAVEVRGRPVDRGEIVSVLRARGLVLEVEATAA